MDTPSTSAAALKLEIERLTGVITRHKTGEPVRPTGPTSTAVRPRNNVYVNPNYKPPSKTSGPPISIATQAKPISRASTTVSQDKHDVVIDGVAFKSSGRSLVRKDLSWTEGGTEVLDIIVPVPMSSYKPPLTGAAPPPVTYVANHSKAFIRNNAGMLLGSSRTYKPKVSRRGRGAARGAARGRNMTLDNTRRPYQSRRINPKRKYSDKPCPRFTTTGSCNRGLTCMYQHDPSKIAICWSFLQGNCPHTAETCPLSHDPTPERTPLCVHFANNGRCNRPNCPFPHVHVGPREGICRDFAVLGYCDKGLDCDKQHVRECPDFAEKGVCTTKACKLPHVIRANRNRKAPPSTTATQIESSVSIPSSAGPDVTGDNAGASGSRQITAEDGQLGDEFISLTFNESESDESDEDEDEGEDDEEEVAPRSDEE